MFVLVFSEEGIEFLFEILEADFFLFLLLKVLELGDAPLEFFFADDQGVMGLFLRGFLKLAAEFDGGKRRIAGVTHVADGADELKGLIKDAFPYWHDVDV